MGPNWQMALTWIKAMQKGDPDNFFKRTPTVKWKRASQNRRELVFNIGLINVKVPASHTCTRCQSLWQISQTCYLSSPSTQAGFFFFPPFLFCWRKVTEGLIKKAGNSSILKKAPVRVWQSAHGFSATPTWPAVSLSLTYTRIDTHAHNN